MCLMVHLHTHIYIYMYFTFTYAYYPCAKIMPTCSTYIHIHAYIYIYIYAYNYVCMSETFAFCLVVPFQDVEPVLFARPVGAWMSISHLAMNCRSIRLLVDNIHGFPMVSPCLILFDVRRISMPRFAAANSHQAKIPSASPI